MFHISRAFKMGLFETLSFFEPDVQLRITPHDKSILFNTPSAKEGKLLKRAYYGKDVKGFSIDQERYLYFQYQEGERLERILVGEIALCRDNISQWIEQVNRSYHR